VKLSAKSASTYLLIITRREASEILLLPNGRSWMLPRVEIDPEQRLAEQATLEAAKAWKIETYCLFTPNACHPDDHRQAASIVMEAVKENAKAPAGTYWIPRSVAMRCCDSADAAGIKESLERLDAYATDEGEEHFTHCGWLRELFRWTQQQIAPYGMQLTGAFRQLNAGPTFSLIRFETARGAVWFKATGEPNAHELPITVALARLFPRFLPRILGVHAAWNGWLSEEAPGAALDEITEFAAWERVAEELARLQIESIGRTDELLEAHLRDLRIPALRERIDPFISRMNELMTAQKKQSPSPLHSSELKEVAEGLKESLGVLETFELPYTLGHTDCNPGNIFLTQRRCLFLDWSEGCVTNPLVTLQFLREYLAHSGSQEPAGGEKLTHAYLRPWARMYTPADLRRALTLMPLIATFAYAVATDTWRELDPEADEKQAGYYRSLARRMHREATEIVQRCELCQE